MMLSKILEILTGKDDLERVVSKDDTVLLNKYFETRTLYFPVWTAGYIEGTTATQQDISDLKAEGEQNLENNDFESIIVEDDDGKKILPAFSSIKKAKIFGQRLANESDNVLSLGVLECLLPSVIKTLDVDVVDLNRFSPHHRELNVGENLQE